MLKEGGLGSLRRNAAGRSETKRECLQKQEYAGVGAHEGAYYLLLGGWQGPSPPCTMWVLDVLVEKLNNVAHYSLGVPN